MCYSTLRATPWSPGGGLPPPGHPPGLASPSFYNKLIYNVAPTHATLIYNFVPTHSTTRLLGGMLVPHHMSGLLPETSSTTRLLGGRKRKSAKTKEKSPRNLSKKMWLEISRRGVQFLAPESLCSPSYEGLKVHVSQNTILTLKTI